VISKNEQITTKYRWNCSDCDTIFVETPPVITLNKSAVLEIEANKNNGKYGDNYLQSFMLHKAINSEIKQSNAYSDFYKASGKKGLVDGKIGSINYRDGNWQGFSGDDINCIIDLGTQTAVSEISANFLHRQRSWIFVPSNIIIQTSTDGKNWKDWVSINSKIDPKTEENTIEKFSKIKKTVNTRFIKFFAKNIGKLPDWHDAAGSKGWLFIDEIIVN
jgi:hexosaminidase